MGMGPGRIPWHEALRWAETYGFDDDDTESLIDLIERLDVEDLSLQLKDRKDGENRSAGH